jgi:hypothetical protein
VQSEENGRTETVSRWGVRVSQAIFEEVGRDKNDDGIIQRNILGEKRRGQMETALSDLLIIDRAYPKSTDGLTSALSDLIEDDLIGAPS